MKKTFMRTVGVLSTAAMLAVGAMSITASADGAATLPKEVTTHARQDDTA